jgi:hypothetical protein
VRFSRCRNRGGHRKQKSKSDSDLGQHGHKPWFVSALNQMKEVSLSGVRVGYRASPIALLVLSCDECGEIAEMQLTSAWSRFSTKINSR